jgi:hypothetical protein
MVVPRRLQLHWVLIFLSIDKSILLMLQVKHVINQFLILAIVTKQYKTLFLFYLLQLTRSSLLRMRFVSLERCYIWLSGVEESVVIGETEAFKHLLLIEYSLLHLILFLLLQVL